MPWGSKEKHREYDRRYYLENREKRLAYVRKWKKENPEKLRAQLKRHYQRHKEKHAEYRNTHRKQRRAEGKARWHIPLANKCIFCGRKENLVRHHADYDKPLEVVTVCRPCHRKIHLNQGV